VRQKIKLLFTKEGAERNVDRRKLEDFYYTVIYDVVRDSGHYADTMLKLKSLKTKIIRLNNTYRQRMMLNTAEQDRIDGETLSLHHHIKCRKRQENLIIRTIRDDNRVTQETSPAILNAFTTHFRKAFQSIDVQEDCMKKVLQHGIRPITPEMNSTLTEPIIVDEFWKAISQGKPHKAPGPDGIGLEFYRSEWDVIKNELI